MSSTNTRTRRFYVFALAAYRTQAGLTGRVQYEALRRVHLIPPNDVSEEDEGVNANVFRNLDSPVSEGGENFSTG